MTLVVSCGEPAGIGPEIAARAWARLGTDLPFLWIGDPRHLPDGTPVAKVEGPKDAAEAAGRGVPVLARDFGPPAIPGRADPAHAPHVVAAIDEGVALVQAGRASALVTAPIHKAALMTGAGFAYPGHTEYLAHLAGVRDVVMMLACPELRVVPATIHIPLSQVPTLLTAEGLERTIRITRDALVRDFGCRTPRIAVAGLNPHAGEEGKIGTEERDLIAPLLDRLRAEGMALTGPLPADTMFHAGGAGGVRCGGVHVPRPGPRADQDHRLRRGRQRHARPALRPHLARPRHRLRHCRQGAGGRHLDDRGAAHGGRDGGGAGGGLRDPVGVACGGCGPSGRKPGTSPRRLTIGRRG